MKDVDMILVSDAVYNPKNGETAYCTYVEYWNDPESDPRTMITTTAFRTPTKNQHEAEARAVLAGLTKILSMDGVESIHSLTVYCDSAEVVAGVATLDAVTHNPYLENPIRGILERMDQINDKYGAYPRLKVVPNRTGSFDYECLLHSKCCESAFNRTNQST